MAPASSNGCLSPFLSLAAEVPAIISRSATKWQREEKASRKLHRIKRDSTNGHMNNDWYVLLALLLCIAILAAWLLWRRGRKARATIRHGRADALARDLSTWDPARARRRYWQGRMRSTEDREEGLNEHGEAPPPYDPKANDENTPVPVNNEQVTLPLRVLVRDQFATKPPEYLATSTIALDADGETSATTSRETTTRLPV